MNERGNTKTSSVRLGEQTSRGETGGEAGGKGTALSSVTDSFEFPAASGNSSVVLLRPLLSFRQFVCLPWQCNFQRTTEFSG